MIWAVFRKDWALLWPIAVLVTLIQVALEWASYQFGFFGVSPVAREIMRLLTPAWFIGVIALAVVVVHEDTIPGVDQDWLIRPLSRTDLLLAKLLFVAVTVCAPMLVVNIVDELAQGFPFGPSLGYAVYKELYLFVCLLVPAVALASATRNAVELVVLVAGLLLLYVVTVWLSAALLGPARCPTCETSVTWIQSLLQHCGILVGSAVVLGFQYYERRTSLSRVLLAAGVVLLVVVQLPWNVAFAIQTWLGAPLGTAPAALQITAGETTIAASTAGGRNRQDNAKRATQALLQGDVDAAVEIQQSMRRNRTVPVTFTVPLQVRGATHNEFLVVDRADFTVLDMQGVALYRGSRPEKKSAPLSTDATGTAIQTFEMPAAVYQKLRGRAASLVIDYSLTVRALVAQYKMPATGGELRAAQIGICRSDADASASIIRCRQFGRPPNCYTATLYAPDGRHNPEVRNCGSDYRPYIPSPLNIVSSAGVDLPMRDSYGVAHYDVDGSQIQDSYIVMKVYETGEHFQRRVTSPLQPE